MFVYAVGTFRVVFGRKARGIPPRETVATRLFFRSPGVYAWVHG
jgi:hypothetical protein